jgi:hypothetical protein
VKADAGYVNVVKFAIKPYIYDIYNMTVSKNDQSIPLKLIILGAVYGLFNVTSMLLNPS